MRRRGYTLFELVVTMGVTATLSTIAVATLVGLYRVQESVHQQIDCRWSLSRLDSQFRTDLADSHQVKLDGSNTDTGVRTLTLQTQSTGVVQYEFHDRQIIRQVNVEDETTRRDAYRLPSSVTTSVEVVRKAEDGRSPHVSLAATRSHEPSDDKILWHVRAPIPQTNSGSD